MPLSTSKVILWRSDLPEEEKGMLLLCCCFFSPFQAHTFLFVYAWHSALTSALHRRSISDFSYLSNVDKVSCPRTQPAAPTKAWTWDPRIHIPWLQPELTGSGLITDNLSPHAYAVVIGKWLWAQCSDCIYLGGRLSLKWYINTILFKSRRRTIIPGLE